MNSTDNQNMTIPEFADIVDSAATEGQNLCAHIVGTVGQQKTSINIYYYDAEPVFRWTVVVNGFSIRGDNIWIHEDIHQDGLYVFQVQLVKNVIGYLKIENASRVEVYDL